MKTKCLLFTALLFSAAAQSIFPQATVAQPAPNGIQSLSIDEAVRIALENNLVLRRNAINLETARRGLNHSWNSLSPSLTASALLNHPTSTTGPVAPIRADDWMPGFNFSAGVTFSASVIENIRRARADFDTGALSYEAARVEIELQVRRLFYQILLLDANRELAIRNFQSAQSRYQQTVALANVGQVPQLDALSARVDMENLRPVVASVEIAYRNALDSFMAILGLPAGSVITLDGDLNVRAAFNVGAAEIAAAVERAGTPLEVSAAIAGIAGNSLEVSILLATIRSLEAQRNTVRNAAHVPSLMLQWDSAPMYFRQPHPPMNLEGWHDNSGSFSVILGLSLDSFFPWSVARTNMAAINDAIRATEIQMSETLRNRENRIIQSIRTVVGILEFMEAMRLNVELAQNAYEIISGAFSVGAADYQRVRSAWDGLAQANYRLLQEQFNLAAALLDLERELSIPFGTL